MWKPAWLAAALAAVFATPAAAQLGADAQKVWADYERLGPHKVFMLAPDRKGYLWAGAPGADPGGAVERGLKYCEDTAKAKCTLYAVNNPSDTLLLSAGVSVQAPAWKDGS